MLEFFTIPDPDGWHPHLRLKGDWLVFKITAGGHSGYGEASHSMQDDKCRHAALSLYKKYVTKNPPTLERLQTLEDDLLQTEPDFVTATAWSGINQALYDLLAKREGVPVWQLFADRPGAERLPLYTTINRALRTRSLDNYVRLVEDAIDQGFRELKCAPFDAVTAPEAAFDQSRAGMETLRALRESYPDLGIRVDFHERFDPTTFFQILPELEQLHLQWIEEPFALGMDYAELRLRTTITTAAGELFWGTKTFQEIRDNRWVDVIMPDVKHVGGFGPLLRVMDLAKGHIEVSPHNPSGPVSTAASLHAAILHADTVKSLEFAYDGTGSRATYGELMEDGCLQLSHRPGWGIDPAALDH